MECWIIVTCLIVWYAIGVAFFLYTEYKEFSEISLGDIIVSLLVGIGGLITVLSCLAITLDDIIIFKRR